MQHFTTRWMTTDQNAMTIPAATAVIPNAQDRLIVIDFVMVYSAASAADGQVTVQASDSTTGQSLILAGDTVSSGTNSTLYLPFPGGLPCWTPASAGGATTFGVTHKVCNTVDLTVSYADSGGTLQVGYHYENPSLRV